MFDRITETSLLYDFYGRLLTERQREVVELYHEEDYSLAEIAEKFSITRQGVHDTLKTAEKALADYEEKLGLVERFEESEKKIARIGAALDRVAEEHKDDAVLCKKLGDIKDIIEKLDV